MWIWLVLLLFYCPGPSLHELRRVYSLGLDCNVCTDARSCKEPEHLQLNWKWLSAAVTSINMRVCLHRLWLPGGHFSCLKKNNTCHIKHKVSAMLMSKEISLIYVAAENMNLNLECYPKRFYVVLRGLQAGFMQRFSAFLVLTNEFTWLFQMFTG